MNTSIRPGSIRARLVLSLGGIAVLVFAAVGILLHVALRRVLLADEAADLHGKIQVVQHFIDDVHSSDDVPMLRRHLYATSIGGRYRWSVWLVRPDGSLIYGAEPVPPSVRSEGTELRLRRQDGVELRGTSYPLVTNNPLLSGSQVLIGMDPRPRAEMLRRYDGFSVAICLVGVLCTILLSAYAMRHGLRSIRTLSEEAAAIRPGALVNRLTVPPGSAELLPLATRFNEVLERMESAWIQMESFNADVAHELRTPLAILISGAEIALGRERPLPELRETLESHLEELRALASMINDMLFLARADRGEALAHVEQISLHEEARRVGDFVEAMLEEKAQRLEVKGDANIRANRSLIRRALVNLLTNGARHAPEGACLIVLIDVDGSLVRVTVSNPGDPIADEVRGRMFDRFWRGESSRAKSGDRFGLGLAIVRAIAQMHGGETAVSCEAGWTHISFTLRF